MFLVLGSRQWVVFWGRLCLESHTTNNPTTFATCRFTTNSDCLYPKKDHSSFQTRSDFKNVRSKLILRYPSKCYYCFPMISNNKVEPQRLDRERLQRVQVESCTTTQFYYNIYRCCKCLWRCEDGFRSQIPRSQCDKSKSSKMVIGNSIPH